MRKSLLKVMFMAMFMLCIVPASKVFAEDTVYTVNIGKNTPDEVKAEVNETKQTVRIYAPSGTGYMQDFTPDVGMASVLSPWYYRSISSVTIEEGVKNVGNYTFGGSSNSGFILFTTVNIPNSVESIGNGAFYNNKNLKTVSGMSGVENIGYNAFYDCYQLANIPIIPNLKVVGESAFYSTNITTINAPKLTTVGASSFKGVTSLTTLNTPSLDKIGVSAFEGNTSLSTVSIANNPTIGLKAFKNTPVHASYHGKSTVAIGLNNINDVIAEYNDYTQIIRIYGSGAMYDFANHTNLLSYNYLTTDNISKLVIEEGVTNVGAYLLYKVVSIPEVHIASTVKSIGLCAFSDMKATSPRGLLKVTGMQGVETIKEYAFYNSYNLTTIDALPLSLTTIGESAFGGTSSLNGLVNKSKNSQTIGSNAFSGMGSSIAENERVVSANSTNATFVAAIQNLNLKHQIIYLDAVPDPADYTLEQWVANGNNADDWFTDGRSISTYILDGGTADSWGNLYGWYPNSFLSFGSASSGWLSFGGTSGLWTSTGGTASSWMSAGGSGSSWVSAGGTQESFIAAGGTIADFSITTPDKVSNTAAQIILTADQTLFGYSFPTDIPIHQLYDFTVVTPSDLQIINLSAAGQIMITSISVEGLEGWDVEDFNADFKQMTIDTEKFSISLNGNRVDKNTSSIPVQGELAMLIRPGAALDLDVEFKMSGQSKQLVNTPAQILFTLDWYK